MKRTFIKSFLCGFYSDVYIFCVTFGNLAAGNTSRSDLKSPHSQQRSYISFPFEGFNTAKVFPLELGTNLPLMNNCHLMINKSLTGAVHSVTYTSVDSCRLDGRRFGEVKCSCGHFSVPWLQDYERKRMSVTLYDFSLVRFTLPFSGVWRWNQKLDSAENRSAKHNSVPVRTSTPVNHCNWPQSLFLLHSVNLESAFSNNFYQSSMGKQLGNHRTTTDSSDALRHFIPGIVTPLPKRIADCYVLQSNLTPFYFNRQHRRIHDCPS